MADALTAGGLCAFKGFASYLSFKQTPVANQGMSGFGTRQKASNVGCLADTLLSNQCYIASHGYAQGDDRISELTCVNH
jgi:hypothetical protein